ncbi:dephospho-CoA kinase [Rhodovulum imhoffii]|uniref:Dephospho-CoA kinase n=1 Tax=Rhodovulum imhoffii TaxID=365340 RepID=A0A2T5BRL1_9RHOB|nr:dephospho-CoA kinase [Rhodovulum imhoffii]MBK5934037.1 dephospho-CoA kinase [Rhodovulum imhoffii]PTN01922.1 dephospho-CoA kinase [Rhodovulum imhoffii]
MSGAPFLLGLTGSIGMGKSTTAGFFREAGVPVWDADAAVHRLYAPGGAGVVAIATLCPGAVRDGRVDRAALKAWIDKDTSALSRIETVIHPLVVEDRRAFIADHMQAPLIVLDIPLLFETGAESILDGILVVTAPLEIQRARVLARPGMTEIHLSAILARQMPDTEKRARADYVIETHSLEQTRVEVQTLIGQIEGRQNARNCAGHGNDGL